MTTEEQSSPAGAAPEALLRPEVLAAFDRGFFEREGYWVWDGVLTDEGRRRWTATLERLQGLNDSFLQRTDWGALDYAGMGLTAPDPEVHAPGFLASCCGGSEQMRVIQMTPGLRDYMKDHGLFGPGTVPAADGRRWEGVMPEYFSPAYDGFILDVATTHPQMMELFGRLLGPRFLLDHILMLNRPPGSTGRRWHAHGYRQGQYETEDVYGRDNDRPPSREYFPHQCVRTLCYPEGMGVDDGGGELAVVPGAHLYRSPYLWNTRRSEFDEEFRAGWMRGRVHAFTGEPLRIQPLSLNPGSMVSFVHHMPHRVGFRDDDAPTRWGLLMAYRTPDPDEAEQAPWNEGVPAHWAARQDAAGRITPSMRRVFEGDNPPA